MRLLITGGSGFIGSHLLAALSGDGHEIFSLSRQRAANPPVAAGVQPICCDLRDPAAVRDALKKSRPDVVIHLASVSPVAYSYDHPNEVLEVNLTGTVNLAEGCRQELGEIRRFLFASTSEIYGLGPLPKKEETPQNPGSPYSISKFAAEKYLVYLRDAYNFPVTILRPFNTYGRKGTTSFVVERILWQMLCQNTVKLGDPDVIRDWLHIDDHVQAYKTCLENNAAKGEILNFATGRGVSVAELVDLLRRMTGFNGEVQWHTLPKRPLDVPAVVGDATRAATLLGWRAAITLEEGLHRAVAYWRQRLQSGGPAGSTPALLAHKGE